MTTSVFFYIVQIKYNIIIVGVGSGDDIHEYAGIACLPLTMHLSVETFESNHESTG